MDVRSAARGLALNRMVFGLNDVVRPAAVGISWVGGPAGRRAATQGLAHAKACRPVQVAFATLVASGSTAVGAWAALALRSG